MYFGVLYRWLTWKLLGWRWVVLIHTNGVRQVRPAREFGASWYVHAGGNNSHVCLSSDGKFQNPKPRTMSAWHPVHRGAFPGTVEVTSDGK